MEPLCRLGICAAIIAIILFIVIIIKRNVYDTIDLINIIFFVVATAVSITSFYYAHMIKQINEKTQEIEDTYNSDINSGYTVYLNGREVDAKKIIFSVGRYNYKFDDANKKIILMEK